MILKRSLPLPARRALLCGSALGCSLLILGSPDQALADNECGTDTVGATSLTCAGTYPTGITYTGVDDLSLTISPAGVVTNLGVYVEGSGDLQVTGQPGGAGISADGASGISVLSTDGAVTVTALAVTTTNGGIGINATGADSVTVNAGDVSTDGDGGIGISTYTNGPTTITATSVDTLGDNADAIHVEGDGAVTVTATTVSTQGDNSAGIRIAPGVLTRGPVTINAESVSTNGLDSHGIHVVGSAQPVVIASSDPADPTDRISTEGNNSVGILVQTGGDVTIDVNEVRTMGGYDLAGSYRGSSDAINVTTTSGVTRINANILATAGVNAHGVRFNGSGGARAIIDVGTVTATARDTTAISLETDGDSSITADSITTSQFEAHGVRAQMIGAASITLDLTSVTVGDALGVQASTESGAINATLGTVRSASTGVSLSSDSGAISATVQSATSTGINRSAVFASTISGDISLTVIRGEATRTDGNAILAATETGDIVVGATTLIAGGRNGAGMRLSSTTGAITARSGTITTAGFGGIGIDVFTDGGAVLVNSGSITSTGDYGRGINVLLDNLDGVAGVETVDIASTSIVTGGLEGTAVAVAGLNGRVDVASGTIETSGLLADGIRVETIGGDIEIDSDSITTHGDDTTAIYARSETGDIDIASGLILTEGDGAFGIRGYNEDGRLIIASRSITMLGGLLSGQTFAAAIRAENGDGDTSIVSGAITLGADSDGVDGISVDNEDGAVRVESTTITTSGDNSTAIDIITSEGEVFVDSGSIVTNGVNGRGINVFVADNDQTAPDIEVVSDSIDTAGAGATGITIDVEALGGLVSVDSGGVSTDGANADGISVATVDSGILIDSGVINTVGVGAYGINAFSETGTVTIDSDTVNSTGAAGAGQAVSAAIWARAGGNVVVRSGAVVAGGANRHGVVAESTSGAVTLQIDDVDVTGPGADAVRATAAGALTAAFTGAVSSDLGLGLNLSAGGTLTATIATNATVLGGTGGVRLASGAGSTLTNNGRIDADSGYAIDATGGPATINNAGSLRGQVRLTGNGDVLFNTGTWITTGTSDFGGGADVLDSHGLIELAAGTAIQTITFANLERIDNRGRIDLANGRAGDRLLATGAVLNGVNTGVIDMDVDFTTGASDQLVIASATGVTRIDVTALGTVTLGQSFDLIDSTAALTGTEFILTPATEAVLVGYDLVFEADGLVRIASAPTVTAFAPLKTAAAGQRAWTKTAEVWSTRMHQIRDMEDLGSRTNKVEFWAQAYGGEEQFGQKSVYDLANGPVTRDLTTETQWHGFQTGVDGVISTEPASFTWGLTSGYGDVRLDFISHDNLVTLKGYNLGAYGGVSAGLFYADVLVKMDRFSAKADLQEMATSVDFHGQAVGVQGEAGLRFRTDSWTVEPSAGVAWVKADLDSFDVAGSEIAFDDAVSLEGRLGVRISNTATIGGLKLRAFAGGYAVKEFEGENEMTFTDRGTSVVIKDKPADAYGRIEFGVLTQVAPGIHGFIRGEANVGDNANGFTGRFGASWSW